MHASTAVLIAAVLAPVVTIGACSEELAAPAAGAPAPAIDAATVAPGPHNVLSAIVSVRVRNADSVLVRFQRAGTGEEFATPGIVPVADSVTIPVLGLVADRLHELSVLAYGPGGVAAGPPLEFMTGALPSDLPSYSASGVDPSPGYVVFAAGAYGLVIDNTGRVVWYRRFPNGPGLNFMAQPNGHYAARPAPADPSSPALWVELDALGEVTRTLGCALGLRPRMHDLIALPYAGDYWILCDETRTMNLTAVGGVADARVTGTAVQHIGADGSVLFHWSPFDHFEITDVALAERAGPNVNWTHGNALDLDVDGNIVVSFRNLGEITKIDGITGEVLWRLGGLRNQFTFDGTGMPAFARQHGVRAYAEEALLILDNTGDPLVSRAERYAIDESTRTARLLHSYASSPAVVTQIGGSVQDLPRGRALVSFGTAGRVEEYDAEGRVVWRIEGNAGYVFRAQRIRSLYAPGHGTRSR